MFKAVLEKCQSLGKDYETSRSSITREGHSSCLAGRKSRSNYRKETL